MRARTFGRFPLLPARSSPSSHSCSLAQELAESDTVLGAYEIPVLQKAFLGLGESAAEATGSQCSEYIGAGVILLIMLFSMVLGVSWLMYRYKCT